MEMKIDNHLEHCWILLGGEDRKLWWGHCHKMTKGQPCSVDFDANYVLKMEETKSNVIGFYHTHPGMLAVPSDRDHRTMRAWHNSFGKSLVCVIKGSDGLRAWWYDDDESNPLECQVKQFGGLLVGTTEVNNPFEGLDFEVRPEFKPIEEFMPEDERVEWEFYIKEIEDGGIQS